MCGLGGYLPCSICWTVNPPQLLEEGFPGDSVAVPETRPVVTPATG